MCLASQIAGFFDLQYVLNKGTDLDGFLKLDRNARDIKLKPSVQLVYVVRCAQST